MKKIILILCLLTLGLSTFAQYKKHYSINGTEHDSPNGAMYTDDVLIRELKLKARFLEGLDYLDLERADSIVMYLNEYNDLIAKIRDTDAMILLIISTQTPTAEEEAMFKELKIVFGEFKSQTNEEFQIDELRQMMDMAYSDIQALHVFLTKYDDMAMSLDLDVKKPSQKKVNKEADKILKVIYNNFVKRIMPLTDDMDKIASKLYSIAY